MRNAATPPDGQQTVDNTLHVPVQALADTSQIAASIEEGVNTFMETVPPLIKVLDEVAKVHPFISGTNESTSKTRALVERFISCCPRIQGRLHLRSTT